MKFMIMGKKGDAVYDYDVETAEVKFNELLTSNLLPVVCKGAVKEIAKKFDPDADEVTWIPKIAGG